MLAKKFRSLVNGGAAVAGADGLRAEINALEAERAKHTVELGDIPARREEVILTDDHNDALDKLEARERELYRYIERIDLQVLALRERLPEQQGIGRRARIEHHRSALIAAAAEVEKAVIASIAANAEAFAAIEDARRELGDEANRLLPLVHFAGLPTDQCLEIWRSQLETQNQRIAREPAQRPGQHRSLFPVWQNAAGD